MADAPAAEPTTAPPPTPASPPPTPSVPVPAPPPSAPTAAQPPAATADSVEQLRAEVKRWRETSEQWESRSKGNFEKVQAQEGIIRLIAEKVGVEIDGKPDATKLADKLTKAQTEAADRARELAIFRAAASANANADALLDSRGFMARTADLDPSASDFSDRVKALVAEAAAANPSLVVQPATPPAPQPSTPAPPQLPASSGADFSGAPPGSGQWTEQDVENASSEALSKAIDQGLLRDLGYAPRRHGRNR